MYWEMHGEGEKVRNGAAMRAHAVTNAAKDSNPGLDALCGRG